MKFSLLVPTRDRREKLNRFIKSIYTTTTSKNKIEVLIACDDNDLGSQAHVKNIMLQYERQLDIKLFTRPQTEFINRDYYNWLAEKATGELLWVLADDLELTQHDWDSETRSAVENFLQDKPDRVVCVSLKDNTPPPSHRLPKFPCFPMFTREAITACGWMLNPMTPTWGADYIAYVIYNHIGRLLELHTKVYLTHHSYHTHVEAKPDSTNKRVGEIFNRLKMRPEYNTDKFISEECPVYQNKILNYIKDFNARMVIEKSV